MLALSWVILDGLEMIAVGFPVAFAGAAMAAALPQGRPHRWLPWRFVAFVGFFLWESLRGGVGVAWRALHPRLPIDPRFHRHRLQLPEGQPRILMISLVSLLPGTLSADLEDDDETLIVHGLTADAEISVRRLERWIAWLFALPGAQL